MLDIGNATGVAVLKLDEDAENDGHVLYHFVGMHDQEALPYVSAARIGKLHGEGTYLIIDCTYSVPSAKEIRVVMDEPTFSEYEEQEPDDEGVAPRG